MLQDEESDACWHYCILSMGVSVTKIVNIFPNDTKCNDEIVRKIVDYVFISSNGQYFCKMNNKSN